MQIGYKWLLVIVSLLCVALLPVAVVPTRGASPTPPGQRGSPTPQPGQNSTNQDHHKIIKQEPAPADSWAIQGAITPCVNGMAGSYPCKGIDLMSRIPLSSFSTNPSSASSIWGYTDLDDNREYAVIGLNNGTGVVDITDPANPRIVGTIAGVSSSWREVKTYQVKNQTTGKWDGYAYITTEGSNGGIQIIDLTKLPNSVSLANTWRGVSTSHTATIGNVDLYTSVANDPNFPPILYINGSNKGGIRFVSLADPINLQEVGAWTTEYVHDSTPLVIRDSRASQCGAGHNPCEVVFLFNGGRGFKIIDVTNKSAPVTLGSMTYPSLGYTHQGWYSKDTNYVFIDDELDESNTGNNTRIFTANISNLRSPTLASTYTGPTKATEHNFYTKGDKLYTAHYRRGLVIFDVSNPTQIKDLGYLDTYPSSDSVQMSGQWGTFPYFRSGLIISSDIQSGLIVAREQTGTVTPTPITRTPTPITPTPPTVTVSPTPGGVVFSDNFETNKGWAVNPDGSDTATLGQWERGDPEATDYNGPKQLGTTVSGSNDLVTGRLVGSGVGSYDIDGGVTSVRSPSISLPSSGNLTLSFRYYLAHASNATSADYLRVTIVSDDPTQPRKTTVFEKLGAASDVDASWQPATVNLSTYAGQTIRIQIEAADAGTASLVEAAVDDVTVTQQ